MYKKLDVLCAPLARHWNGILQSIVGTPHFMSPELLNRKKYDFKTDVWSLGCVMYELSCFRPAFDAFNLVGPTLSEHHH